MVSEKDGVSHPHWDRLALNLPTWTEVLARQRYLFAVKIARDGKIELQKERPVPKQKMECLISELLPEKLK
jgi:hypothetical protein